MHQQTRTVARQLRWWRGLAGGLLALAVLTWALPAGTAPDETAAGGRERLADTLVALERLRPLLRHLTIATDEEGRPELVITGANLRIVNGLGSTDCTNEEGEIPDCPNGLGNLIVGYNEPREGDNVRTGSHNVVVGQLHNFSHIGGLVVGTQNTISGDFASVSGGLNNTASGDAASISGGDGNTASGGGASVSGGVQNTATAFVAAVSGGQLNTASGRAASVSGGFQRAATGEFDWVAGPLFADE